ncbi:hypothetical protein SCACP_37800 [Sporomusa carbonis]
MYYAGNDADTAVNCLLAWLGSNGWCTVAGVVYFSVVKIRKAPYPDSDWDTGF